MCCFRSAEERDAYIQEQRQSRVVDALEAAIENAEIPEVKSVVSSDKKQDGTPGIRNTRTNG
jgi:hypothetical protein